MGAVSTVQISVVLSVVCLVVVFVGGWYLQSSLIQLNTQVMEQQYHNQEQTEQLNKRIIKQNNKISEQQLQMEQLNIIIDVLLDRNGMYKDHYDTRDNTSHHEIVKRQNQQSPTTIKADSTIIKLLHGRDGVQGRDGRDGTPGIKGDRGSKGNQGSKGDQGLNGDKGSKGESKDGRDGRDGAQGIKGDVGPCGDKGDQGLTGPKGEAAGGLIYVRWGHDSCPSNGAQLVYTGRAAGSSHTQKGGGANPQCLPLDPNYLRYRSGAQEYSQMFAAEYHATNGLVASTSGIDVPCAVCYIPTRTALYMIPGKYTCPTGWETEYYGYLTAEYYSFTRSFYTCVDDAMKQVPGSIGFQDGTLFSPVEVKCKSRLCPPYEETKELTCAVCTK